MWTSNFLFWAKKKKKLPNCLNFTFLLSKHTFRTLEDWWLGWEKRLAKCVFARPPRLLGSSAEFYVFQLPLFFSFESNVFLREITTSLCLPPKYMIKKEFEPKRNTSKNYILMVFDFFISGRDQQYIFPNSCFLILIFSISIRPSEFFLYRSLPSQIFRQQKSSHHSMYSGPENVSGRDSRNPHYLLTPQRYVLCPERLIHLLH